jgi:hypothetical protein
VPPRSLLLIQGPPEPSIMDGTESDYLLKFSSYKECFLLNRLNRKNKKTV